MGAYMISLITTSRSRKAVLFVPGVGAAGRCAVGRAAERDAVALGFEAHGVEHARVGRVAQIDGFALRAQGEAKLTLVPGKKAVRRDQGLRWNHEFVGVGIIAERTARDVQRRA